MAATSENDVLFWGTRATTGVSPDDPCKSGNTTTQNVGGSGNTCLDRSQSVHASGADLTGGAIKVASESEGTISGLLE